MSGLFDFSQAELFSFFAVLVRYTTLAAVLPFIGDRMVLGPVKIFFGLAVSIALYPALVKGGFVHPADADIWAASTFGIAGTVALEVMVGLTLGFVARVLFDVVQFAGNMVGTFMGLASASTFDPHQESQTQIIAQLHMTLAMLMFLALDGHHLMLNASLRSYEWVGIGKLTFGALFQTRLIDMTGQILLLGMQLSAPIAIAMFVVNVAFGVVSKAMPQLNVLVLSFGVSALVGFAVMLVTAEEMQILTGNVLARMEDWLTGILKTMS